MVGPYNKLLSVQIVLEVFNERHKSQQLLSGNAICSFRLCQCPTGEPNWMFFSTVK